MEFPEPYCHDTTYNIDNWKSFDSALSADFCEATFLEIYAMQISRRR